MQQCASNEEAGQSDRQLRGEPDVDGGLEHGVCREAGDQPLDQLLREEGERRDDRERPRRRMSLQAARHPQ